MKILTVKKTLLVLLFSFFAFNATEAQKIPTLDFFHGRECPHCQEEKAWLPVLKQMYPTLVVNEYEVWHDTANQKLWGDRLAEFGMAPSAVPTNILEGEVVVGFNKDRLLAIMSENYGAPEIEESSIVVAEDPGAGAEKTKKIIFVIFGALILVGAVFMFSPKK